jgi:hypothetical protein
MLHFVAVESNCCVAKLFWESENWIRGQYACHPFVCVRDSSTALIVLKQDCKTLTTMMTENIYQQAAAVLRIEDFLRWFGSLPCMDSKISKLIENHSQEAS